jgi:hypothetical protein
LKLREVLVQAIYDDFPGLGMERLDQPLDVRILSQTESAQKTHGYPLLGNRIDAGMKAVNADSVGGDKALGARG